MLAAYGRRGPPSPARLDTAGGGGVTCRHARGPAAPGRRPIVPFLRLPGGRRGAVPGRASAARVRRDVPGAPHRVQQVRRPRPVRRGPAVAARDALGLLDRAPVVSRRAGAVRRRRRRPARGRLGALQPDRRRPDARGDPLRHAGGDDDRREPAGQAGQRRRRVLLPPRAGRLPEEESPWPQRSSSPASGMLKFGRYPDKDVPELGGEAALPRARRRRARHPRRRVHGRGLPLPGERDGRPAHPAGDRTDGHPGDERRQRLRHRLVGVPRGVAVTWRRASATSRSRSASSRWARWGCSAAAAARASAPRASSAAGSCPRSSARPAWSTCGSTAPRRRSSPRSR